MANLKCKICGGSLLINEDEHIATCEFCGTKQTIPVFDDEKKIAFYERANNLRLKCEFDKASALYETIVTEFPKEAEAYWGLILCKYGIEYVDDDKTGKKILTCHRTLFDSIFNDFDYKNCIKFSDVVARDIYENEAKKISLIQTKILDISSKEEPYDIFICYKETDEKGNRTVDSVLAFDIYQSLVNEGYKVFLSRVSLEALIGHFYEPYIFSALRSSNLMIHVTTSSQNTNSVWVKNEWSRFLDFIKEDKNRKIVVCYKDVSPNDLPDELKFIQGQDMSKIGAMQDLIYGIKKLMSRSIRTGGSINNSIMQETAKEDNYEQEYLSMINELKEVDDFCTYASDIYPIIAFFEKAGTYKLSKKYLYDAKKQYIKKVHNYNECLTASKYLLDLKDDPEYKALKDELYKKTFSYRKKELLNSGDAPYSDAIETTYDLNLCLNSFVSTFERMNLNRDEIDSQIISECSEIALNNLEQSALKVIDNENSKTELESIVSALEECKEHHVDIPNLDNFYNCAKNKVDFIIQQEIEAKKKKKRKKIISIISIVSSIAILIGVIVGVKACHNAGYSSDYIKISVTSKTNDKYNETLADGYVGAGYFYTFKFNVQNTGKYGTECISGNMEVNNASKNTLASSYVNMNGTLNANSSKAWNIQLNVYKGDNAREIWNTNFENLEIKFKITQIKYSDGKTVNFGENKNVVVHECGSAGESSDPQTNYKNQFLNSSVGSTVNFGKYQMKTGSLNETSIPWRVCKITGTKYLLVCNYSLIMMPWCDIEHANTSIDCTWANSLVRKYLNGNFYKNYFTSEEKNIITKTICTPFSDEIELGSVETEDYFYLLTQDEYYTYYPSRSLITCKSTGCLWNASSDDWSSQSYDLTYSDQTYWNRDMHIMGSYYDAQYCITSDGTLSWEEDLGSYFGVRPAVTVDISKLN